MLAVGPSLHGQYRVAQTPRPSNQRHLPLTWPMIHTYSILNIHHAWNVIHYYST